MRARRTDKLRHFGLLGLNRNHSPARLFKYLTKSRERLLGECITMQPDCSPVLPKYSSDLSERVEVSSR